MIPRPADWLKAAMVLAAGFVAAATTIGVTVAAVLLVQQILR